MLLHECMIFMKDKQLQAKLHAVSNVSVIISRLEEFFYWTLNVSRTASYEITLVRLSIRLSLGLSFRPSLPRFVLPGIAH